MKAKFLYLQGCLTVLSFLGLIFFGANASLQAETLKQDNSLVELTRTLQTPEAISRYIWKNLSYETDRVGFGEEDYWQSPEELLRHRRGDCEDFALFASRILKLNGKSSLLVNLRGGGRAHTICLFRENGMYVVIDGDKVIRSENRDLKNFLKTAYPFWDKGAVVAPSQHQGKGHILSSFENKLKAQRILRSSA